MAQEPQPPAGPGPGRSTSLNALNEIKREVTKRNDEVQKVAIQARKAREQEQVARRRRRDLS